MKTMIVFTMWRPRGKLTEDWVEGSEVAEIGKKATGEDYKTGTAFLACIKRMYRNAGMEFKITNVVIG